MPIEVDIGGISYAISYAGRSIYPGLDQINVSVPANVTPGCHVSLIMKTGNYVSNSTTIQIAQTGRTCADPNIGYTPSQLAILTAKSTINVGILYRPRQARTPASSSARSTFKSLRLINSFPRSSP